MHENLEGLVRQSVDLDAKGGGRYYTCRDDQLGVLAFEPLGHVGESSSCLEDAISMHRVGLPSLVIDRKVTTQSAD
jgi:hypothetical protein